MDGSMNVRSHVLSPVLHMALDHMGKYAWVPFSVGYLQQFLDDYPLQGYDLRDKVVVDVGCDRGTTPICWRANGARRVVGYETEPKAIRWMARLRKEAWFDFRGKWTGEYPEGDVFKIDIEGAERILDMGRLANYSLWFVVLHNGTFEMLPTLEGVGGEVVNRHPGEIVVRGGA
jgi:hypothetical protein